ncbi:MAG TPA: molybdopterin-dependent oxidoreductase [Gemmatimonadales bacterium]|nr:molybdopterin-dependent oxidoreductase [Gemmatimonadales bacterium]
MSDEKPENAIDRRRFLTVVGATGAGAAALSGCSTDRVQKLIPYLVQSEDQIPGVATYYASSCAECAAGCGLHVRTREGRAVKLEGNPLHPVNAGTICSRGQAGLQGLYNPDRIGQPMQRQADGTFAAITWDAAVQLLADRLKGAAGKVAVLSGQGAGTFDDLLGDWARAQGGRVVRWEPFGLEPLRLASQRVFGRDEVPVHDFAAARYIVSFGADFLETWHTPVEQQRGFAASHGFSQGPTAKTVYIAPRMDLTGMNADEWVRVTPGSEAVLALAMANVILAERSRAPADANALRGMLAAYTPQRAADVSGLTADQVQRLAREFASGEPSLAVAGGVAVQHREAHELAAAVHLLNYVAGNVGHTVKFGAGVTRGDGYGAVEGLFAAMDRGEVAVALVHQANPLYALPQAGKFAERFAKVGFKVSTANVLDETAMACDLVLPELHALERWDDTRPRAGVWGLMQPVMEPVQPGRHAGDVLLQSARLAGGALAAVATAADFKTYLENAWGQEARRRRAADPVQFWRDALQHGGLYDAAPAAAPVRLAPGAQQVKAAGAAFDGDGAYTLVASPSLTLSDGRGANRPWLLELSDPVTKITWWHWAEVHPATARELDVREGEILELTSPHGTLRAPVYIHPGIHPRAIAVPLGWGHTAYGRYAKDRGANVLDLIGAADGNGYLPYQSTTVQARPTGEYRQVGKTEGTPRQLGRGIAEAMPVAAAVKGLTLREYYEQEGHAEHEVNTEGEQEALQGFRESQVEQRKHGGYAEQHPQWGMTIDLSRCTGCSACVTACYAENNIPTVGEDQVYRGREMTWLRIERFWEGDDEAPEARFVPMLCQHCDNAPCEPVCPVYAAYHTVDGLNGQVYNRCVGTRYCANNCPYKVRYFNWYAYNRKAFPAPLDLQLNPDVTVRGRGVMEKCTFCVHRIRGAQHQARLSGRPLQDGDVVTACQQACPSGAITFGDVKDPNARVVAAARSPRGYHVFEDLNTRPAVTYLAKVRHTTEA